VPLFAEELFEVLPSCFVCSEGFLVSPGLDELALGLEVPSVVTPVFGAVPVW
jgi:hypothetical protein